MTRTKLLLEQSWKSKRKVKSKGTFKKSKRTTKSFQKWFQWDSTLFRWVATMHPPPFVCALIEASSMSQGRWKLYVVAAGTDEAVFFWTISCWCLEHSRRHLPLHESGVPTAGWHQPIVVRQKLHPGHLRTVAACHVVQALKTHDAVTLNCLY